MKHLKRTLVNEEDKRWRRKGGTHLKGRDSDKIAPKVCPDCGGSGSRNPSGSPVCDTCDGLGEVL